ncbi:glycoside hydrolase family 15 protein [Streptomyces lunaelactis]|nr:glycoside hydrolase family 15 protein [Streptomyces lunaelactis]
MKSAALVGLDGSVDWLCLPRFDSPAIFAALLGTDNHGFWRIGPTHSADAPAPPATRRRYRGDSLILETEWDTPSGTARVIDFMPPGDGTPQLIRIVEGVSGRVPMTSVLRTRFSYGRVVPTVHQHDGRTVAVAGPDSVWFDTEAETYNTSQTTHAEITVAPGDRVAFTISWQPSHQEPPALPVPENSLEATEDFWLAWVEHCTYDGPYREAVVRSLITLKALTSASTGGIVAAPTTSLPEEIGGVRNWDYRHVWLRDAALSVSSLLRTGFNDEAHAWHAWLLRAVAGDPQNLQIMYGIAGERDLPEAELGWLPGYENSSPVRVGNAAVKQLQLDVYGEVIDALYLAGRYGLDYDHASTQLLITLVTHLESQWDQPDEGIWEVRGPRRHFVHSKVMAWTAVDRAVRLIEAGHAHGPVVRWRKLRAAIHQDVCAKGFDRDRNTFTQSYGSTRLDAALLVILQVGFLPPDDKRVIGTVEAIQRELSTGDGFLLRYTTDGARTGEDGLPGDEGAFLLCSFGLVEALAAIGRPDEAQELFDRLLRLRNDVGLLAEEWDPQLQRQTGNFPQAFSHIGLVNAALALSRYSGASTAKEVPVESINGQGIPCGAAALGGALL